ncbi:hypothetical protein XENOCAPTIV_020304, partial [Xenoophorus captivus]
VVCVLQTAVGCVPRGVFSCPLVVTMRPVPAGFLDAVVEVTHQNPLAHGAPVHVGDPEPALAFSHSPGCMFLTDIPDSPSPSNNMNPDLKLTPLCFQVTQNPLLYSLVSKAAAGKIRQLEQIIGDDPGQRGIRNLFAQDELLRSCLALSHSSSVAITTGFPTHYMHRYAAHLPRCTCHGVWSFCPTGWLYRMLISFAAGLKLSPQ